MNEKKLNAICFVLNHTMCKDASSSRIIFEIYDKIIALEMAEKYVFMFTFCDKKEPRILETLTQTVFW